MPTGRMILSVLDWRVMPTEANDWTKESIKKLKYLKKPNNPKFNPMVV
jgi:hypothetical protein